MWSATFHWAKPNTKWFGTHVQTQKLTPFKIHTHAILTTKKEKDNDSVKGCDATV
jgi:hypothetical protein